MDADKLLKTDGTLCATSTEAGGKCTFYDDAPDVNSCDKNSMRCRTAGAAGDLGFAI